MAATLHNFEREDLLSSLAGMCENIKAFFHLRF